MDHYRPTTDPLCGSFVVDKMKLVQQLRAVNPRDDEELDEIFKAFSILFDEVIDRLPTAGALLARIKDEYEQAIVNIQSRGRLAELENQRSLVKSMEMGTISNYVRRIKDLEFKTTKIKLENEKIKQEIAEMSSEVDSIVRQREELESSQRPPSPKLTSSMRKSLGLSLEEATSLTQLERELDNARKELEEVKMFAEKRYIPAERKSKLRRLLSEKEEIKNKVDEANNILSQQLKRLKLATQAVATYGSYLEQHGLDSSSLPLGHYITAVIESNYDSIEDEEPDQDPVKEIEAEMILDCFEKFNELFESEKYQEAALHAASSPKGVLRTIETLNKFKHSARPTPGEKHPLLCYCEHLMQCAPAYRPLSKEEALECVNCALENNGIPLIYHWIAQGVLYPSIEVGRLIFNYCHCTIRCVCSAMKTAFTVLDRCGEHKLASLCLVYQEQFITFLSYGKKTHQTKKDIVELLCTRPSVKFLEVLTTPQGNNQPSITILEAITILLDNGQADVVATLLTKELQDSSGKFNGTFVSDADVWESIAYKLSMTGFPEPALDLLSSVMVYKALHSAVNSLAVHEETGVTASRNESSAWGTQPTTPHGEMSDATSSEESESEGETSSGGYSSELESDSPAS